MTLLYMEEAVGFEPTDPDKGSAPFQGTAFNHSATLPCLHLGSDSRLTARIEKPLKGFDRVPDGLDLVGIA
jgi:hypothetical protein